MPGGRTDDFSSSTLVAVAPGAGIDERARGFTFSTELFHDQLRDEILVLDVGAGAITAICRDVDGDAVYDADDPCIGGVAVTRPKLQLRKLDTPPGDDRVAFTGQMTVPLSPAIDPVTEAGRKLNRQGTTWTYKTKTNVAGIGRSVVKTTPKVPGLVRFRVAGKRGAFPAARAALPLTAVFALDPAAGQCGTADFGGPVPRCAFNAKGSTVACE